MSQLKTEELCLICPKEQWALCIVSGLRAGNLGPSLYSDAFALAEAEHPNNPPAPPFAQLQNGKRRESFPMWQVSTAVNTVYTDAVGFTALLLLLRAV